MNSEPRDGDSNLPSNSLNISPLAAHVEVWLAEQRKLIAEEAARSARLTPEERLEQWKRDHANDTPFVM